MTPVDEPRAQRPWPSVDVVIPVLNEREADALGANFFVRRRPGGLSVGVARLYFAAPQAAIVTPNNAVCDGSGQRFFPVENQAITADNMLFNVEDNLYYMDIVVRAEEEGSSYNIDYNTCFSFHVDAAIVLSFFNCYSRWAW